MQISRALCFFLSLLASQLARAEQEDNQANWPRFRGSDGAAYVSKGVAPLTAKELAWSVDVPSTGFGSPVIWGDRVFLSAGDDAKCLVLCFALSSGQMLWQAELPKPPETAETPDQSGMAAATVATDGSRVFAMFANGQLAAVNFDGKIAWSKQLAAPKNSYGHATSLLTWEKSLIVQFDQGEADDKLSQLYAFSGETGEVLWQQPREVGASWATPIIINGAVKPQLITLAVPWVISYAPSDGKEIWRAECLDGEVTPSPVFAGGKLLVVSPLNKLQSIRVDGQGDVTKTHLEWAAEDGIPDVTSPVSNGELVFVIDTGGTLTCFDCSTGKTQWSHDMEEECKASPSIIGDKLYLITMKGSFIVVEASREFKEVARSQLGDQVYASPAFVKNKMVVRGLKHLMCLVTKAR